jgi:hypothetical protein
LAEIRTVVVASVVVVGGNAVEVDSRMVEMSTDSAASGGSVVTMYKSGSIDGSVVNTSSSGLETLKSIS